MDFPLVLLPDNVLIQIVEKTSFTTLCRLRKSHKNLDTLVEKNRFSIRAVADAEGDEEEVYFGSRLVTDICPRRFVIEFCISTQAIRFTILRKHRIYEVSPKSLSALYFKYVEIGIDEYQEGASDFIYSLEDLKEMHYSCEKLSIDSYGYEVDEETIEKLIIPFKFSKLSLDTCSTFRILHNPIIQHCEEINMSGIVEIPKNPSSVLRHVQIKKLELTSRWLEVPDFVSSILGALKEDSKAIGNIEHIILCGSATNFDCFSQYLVWEGEVASYINKGNKICKTDCSFYIVEVKDGIVLLVENPLDFEMIVIKDNIWEKLMIIILEILTKWMPCDYSAIWDEFMNTTDFTETIEKVMGSF